MRQNTKALFFSLLAVLTAGAIASAQTGTGASQKRIDKAAAYYNFAMGHLYSDLAGSYGNRGEYLNKAIDHYKQALRADPGASFISDELSDLYIQSGRLSEAVQESEAAVKLNPNDINARRILGRIFTRMIGDSHQNRINESMLRRAIEQYEKITEAEPADQDSWLTLGRLQKIAQNSVEAEKAYKKVLEIDPENEDAMTGLAMVYSDMGDAKQASEMLRRVADRNPSLRSLSLLAGSYEQMNDYGMAAETLKKALELQPANPELKRALAQNLMLADQYEESLKAYEELAAAEPKDAQLQLRISQLHRQQRRFDKAREASDKARQLDPNSIEIRYNEVSLLEAEGKLPAAIDALKQIIDSTAKSNYAPPERANRVALLERLGLLYRANDQFEQSLDIFRQVGELDPDLAGRAAAQRIETYRLSKDYAKAEAEAEAASQKYPNDRLIKVIRANILADRGKGAQAAAELRTLLDGKNDRDTWLSLAQVYEKSKNYDEMAKAIDEAGKLSTSKDEQEGVHFMRGAMYEKLKKFDQAEAEFRKVIELNPENSSALNYLGYMLADRNVRLQEAQDLIRRALEQDPQNGAYLDSMGWVLFRMGRLQEAEEQLQRSLEKISRDPTVYDHLGDVYFSQGKLKEAITQWEASLKEWEASPPSEVDSASVAAVHKKLEGAKVRLAKENSSKPPQKQ